MENSTGLVSLPCSRHQNVAVVVSIVVNNHDFGPSEAKSSRSGSAQLYRCLMTVTSLYVQALNNFGPAVTASQVLSSSCGTVLRAD